MLCRRFLLRVLDAAITAPRRPSKGLRAHLRTFFGRASNFDRIATSINLADALLPGLARVTTRCLYSTKSLPLLPSTFEFLDYGSGGTVFLLQTHGTCYVLKVYRRSLGQSLTTLVTILREQQRKYDMVRQWYNTETEIVPPGRFLITHGVLLGSPVVALLQPYLDGAKKDLLQDSTDDELFTLLEQEPALKEQFTSFAKSTLAAFSQGENCFDLVGRSNIMLIEEQGRHRLAIVDAGVFNLPNLAKTAPHTLAHMQQLITRLSMLLQALEHGHHCSLSPQPSYVTQLDSRRSGE
jgi:hypothetical protein